MCLLRHYPAAEIREYDKPHKTKIHRGKWPVRRRERSTDPEIATRVKIVALNSEIDAIYYANSLYWGQGEAATHKARGEYRRRLDAWKKSARNLLNCDQPERVTSDRCQIASLTASPKAGLGATDTM